MSMKFRSIGATRLTVPKLVPFSATAFFVTRPTLAVLKIALPYMYQGCLALVATYTRISPDGPAIREHGPLE
jgi:hypothetical protein